MKRAHLIVLSGTALAALMTASTLLTVKLLSKPVCLRAPEVVEGWHTVTAHPKEGFVCGWHQAGVVTPVYVCIRFRECEEKLR